MICSLSESQAKWANIKKESQTRVSGLKKRLGNRPPGVSGPVSTIRRAIITTAERKYVTEGLHPACCRARGLRSSSNGQIFRGRRAIISTDESSSRFPPTRSLCFHTYTHAHTRTYTIHPARTRQVSQMSRARGARESRDPEMGGLDLGE